MLWLFRRYLQLTLLYLSTVSADYDCVCNYNTEKAVQTEASAQSTPIGYMYEFDCKPLVPSSDHQATFLQVMFEHKIGYVEAGGQIEVQICPGSIPEDDKLTTNGATTTIISTIASTTIPTSTTTTPQPTTSTTPTTVTTLKHTHTTVSTTHRQTTANTTTAPTTITTTPKPTTITTTTTPMPTTTTTTPKPTTITTTTTPMPTTTTTTPKPTTITTTTTPMPTTTTTTPKPTTITTATTPMPTTTTTTPKPTTITTTTTPMPTTTTTTPKPTTITTTTTPMPTTTTHTSTTSVTTLMSTTIKQCINQKADIIFVLDSSSSEGLTNFQRQLDFVLNLTDTFDIGPNKVQVAVITFSSSVHNSLYLMQYNNKASLIHAIKQVQYIPGTTATDLALRYVRMNGFSSRYGGRYGVPQFVIVLTDGQSNNPSATANEAHALHNTGAKVIGIGIGLGVNSTELGTIASDKQHTFLVASFNVLHTIQAEIEHLTSSGPCEPSHLPNCTAIKADIVFLLDSSSSEGPSNFQQQLSFAANFSQAFEIGPNNVQISVVTFSSTTHNAFYLSNYTNKASLLNAIHRVQYITGSTHTAEALQFVRETSFLPLHGGRYGVPKIIIIMTDGQSTNPTNTTLQALLTHNSNIQVLAIGIGSGVVQSELQTIASDKQHAFVVASFAALQSIQNELHAATCAAESQVIEACKTKQADIVFVLDASGSEGISNFRKQLDFVGNLSDKFDIGPNGIQVSLVTFSSTTYNEFFLNRYHSKPDLEQAIRNASYSGGGTYTDIALKFVRENSFKAENGGRGSTVTKLVVVITDGNSMNPTATTTEAMNLRNNGVKVISIGIGTSVSRMELQNIASDNQHVFMVADFSILGNIASEIQIAACTATSACSSNPVDILFILDSSSNESSNNFYNQLIFVQNFVQHFDVGPNAVQIALITYGTIDYSEFYFNTYSNKPLILTAIQHAHYQGGSANLYHALLHARLYHFLKARGSRDNATKLVIITTHGLTTDFSKTLTEAQNLKASLHAQIITIGIATNNQYQLNAIATDRSHVYNVGSSEMLQSLQAEIRTQSCPDGTLKPMLFPECGRQQADIVFLLDASSSEGSTNFQKQLNFVRDFIAQFTIGPQAVQVSVIVFSSSVTEIFSLNQYHDQASVLAAIAKISYTHGLTYTDQALQYARLHSFVASKGARSSATHMVIVVTDGQSTNPRQTLHEADLLKNMANTKVVAIGIGSDVNHTELHAIASGSLQTLFAPSFDSLQSLNSQLTYATCQTCGFISKADIVFVLDASSSEGATNFQKQLNFVSEMVHDLQVDPNHVQVGLVTFSDNTHVEFYLNRYQTQSQILTAIQRVTYLRGLTYTDKALSLVRSVMFASGNGGRIDAKRFVIILTDGTSSDEQATIQQANLLKQQQTQIIAIGIGSSINKAELSGIATDSQHAFTVLSFDALRSIRDEIKAAACKDGQTK